MPVRFKIAPSHEDLDPIQYVVPWVHPTLHPKRHLDRFSRFCTAHGRQFIPYNGPHLPPQNYPSHGDLSVTDRPTDRPTNHATRSVSMGRINVRSTAMRPNNNSKHWDSAYLRQGTSYQCRDTDPWSGSPPKFNHLFIRPLPIFPENFMQIRLDVFPKVANRQTDTQTNNDDYIFSLCVSEELMHVAGPPTQSSLTSLKTCYAPLNLILQNFIAFGQTLYTRKMLQIFFTPRYRYRYRYRYLLTLLRPESRITWYEQKCLKATNMTHKYLQYFGAPRVTPCTKVRQSRHLCTVRPGLSMCQISSFSDNLSTRHLLVNFTDFVESVTDRRTYSSTDNKQ